MKRLLTFILTFTLLLTGCGNTSESSTATDSDMMSYDTDLGTVEYKANPKIYADYYVGQLLYLNADLVGADITYPAKTWSDIADQRGVQNISENMEQVAAVKPDLIITIKQDYVDQYSAIAPTIYIPYGKYDQEQIMTELGKITGAEDAAKQWIDQFETNVADLKTEIDNPDLSVGIFDAWGDAMYMYGQNYGRGGYLLYNKLGLKGTDQAEADYIRKDESYATVDAESLLNYAGDVLFVTSTSLDSLEDLPTYSELEAVKNDRVITLDYDTFMYDDPYSLDAQVSALKEIYGTDKL